MVTEETVVAVFAEDLIGAALRTVATVAEDRVVAQAAAEGVVSALGAVSFDQVVPCAADD